jgi:hypothetical protein
MKRALFKALKAREEGGNQNVFVQLGDLRFDFITYGDMTFAVRRDGNGLMSQQYKVNFSGILKALAWIDNNHN